MKKIILVVVSVLVIIGVTAGVSFMMRSDDEININNDINNNEEILLNKGTIETFEYNDLKVEVSNVKRVRTNTMIAEGIALHEYTTMTVYPYAKLKIVSGDDSFAVYKKNDERITTDTNDMVIDITSDIGSIYDRESSLALLSFEIYDEVSDMPKEVSSFVGTVIDESQTLMVVEPNEDEEERKISDRITIGYESIHEDYLYGKGRKVLVTYEGAAGEWINTDDIKTNGYEDFELSVVETSGEKTKTKILNYGEVLFPAGEYNLAMNADYALYYYGLDEVNVFVDGKEMPLETALRMGMITLDGIVAKANNDVKVSEEIELQSGEIQTFREVLPTSIMYKDGGTIEYHYNGYTIIKMHTLDGNRDLYICVSGTKLSDLK